MNHTLFVACFCIGVVIGCVLFLYVRLVSEAKREVRQAPRIPQFICDKHGMFPTKHAMHITVPSDKGPPLVVDMCPMCYDDKMKAAEKVFKT